MERDSVRQSPDDPVQLLSMGTPEAQLLSRGVGSAASLSLVLQMGAMAFSSLLGSPSTRQSCIPETAERSPKKWGGRGGEWLGQARKDTGLKSALQSGAGLSMAQKSMRSHGALLLRATWH